MKKQIFEDVDGEFEIISKYLETEDNPSYKITNKDGLLLMLKVYENNENSENLV